MKKLMILFIATFIISSCSNDDNSKNKTPFEGTWLLTYIGGGHNPENDDPVDVSHENIRYIFQNNYYKFMEKENIRDQGTFSVEDLGKDYVGHNYMIFFKSQTHEKLNDLVQIKQDTILIFTDEYGYYNGYRKIQ